MTGKIHRRVLLSVEVAFGHLLSGNVLKKKAFAFEIGRLNKEITASEIMKKRPLVRTLP